MCTFSKGNNMNLILWRHAEAEDVATTDLARQLTSHGRKQAQTGAKWLHSRLPKDALIFASPAARTIQTVEALTDQYRIVKEIAPGAAAKDVLAAVGWPTGVAQTVVVVGHQPTLGLVAAQLVAGQSQAWQIKKGGIWWLQTRQRNDEDELLVRAVVSPDLA
jgi:phosphohistidine phosphatase